MALIIEEVSRTFNEFLLLPGRTRKDCSVQAVNLTTPLVRHRVGQTAPLMLRSPVTSAIMQAVSSYELAIALAREGGLSFIYQKTAWSGDFICSVESKRASPSSQVPIHKFPRKS